VLPDEIPREARMQKVLAISDFHPRDRIAYWYDVASKVFVKHECRVNRGGAFDATLHRATLGELDIIEADSVGLSYAAVTPRNIAHEDDDVFMLGLQLEGSATLTQDGREATLQPGDFVLLDAQRPFSTHYSAHWRRLFIKIPHRSLKARLAPSSELTAVAVRGAEAVGGLAAGFMSMIPERVGALNSVAKTQIAEHLLDLTALALATAAGKDRPAISSGRALTLLQLRMAIENRLSDPTLDPTTAAAAAGISVRYANALLSQQGTSLERLIVSRRLDRCRRALEDPAQAHRAIGEIAFDWGFGNQSHFNRRFKAEFGCSPSDYRRDVRA
jgi:AraC family transcriptional regulator, positive regulator of tynA and feaB